MFQFTETANSLINYLVESLGLLRQLLGDVSANEYGLINISLYNKVSR